MYSRIGYKHTPLYKPQKTPTTIDVNMLTVAPILVVLATGILIAIILLVIERCVHGNVLKYLPSECVRQHPKD
jgi:hypothetical protein